MKKNPAAFAAGFSVFSGGNIKQFAVWQTALLFPLRCQASLRSGITPLQRRDPQGDAVKTEKQFAVWQTVFS